MTFSLSPSVGLSWPEAPLRDTRAVTEKWSSPRRGANAGIEIGAETWFRLGRSRWKLGVAAGVGYIRRWLTLDGTFTPVSDPDAAVSVRHRYITDQIMLKVAFLAGF